MKVDSILVAALLFGGAHVPAHADALNHSLAEGQLLLSSCASDSLPLRAMCLGYLAAVADGLSAERQDVARSVCPPTLVNLDAYRRAFIAFVERRPETLSRPSLDAVKAALATQWPCP